MPKKELQEAIREWLEQSGYPLEMQVANAFRKAGFRVSQSAFYVDPDTEEQREIDVIATSAIVVGPRVVRFEIVVECKSSRDKPWVVFAAGGEPDKPPLNIAAPATACNPNGRIVRGLLSADGVLKPLGLFTLSTQAGYGIVQALNQKGAADPSYTAQLQAAKAAIALATDENEPTRGLRIRFRGQSARIVTPVIVLDGRLFAAWLDDSGEKIELAEKKTQFVNTGKPEIASHLGLINVVTKDGLGELVSNAAAARDAMLAWCKSNAEKIEEALKKQEFPSAQLLARPRI